MIRHCVIFTCKPEIEQKTLLNVLEVANQSLPNIPVVKSFSIGLDKGLQPGRSGDFAVVADFDSTEDVIEYLQHPVHQEFVKDSLSPIVDTRMSVQFEI